MNYEGGAPVLRQQRLQKMVSFIMTYRLPVQDVVFEGLEPKAYDFCGSPTMVRSKSGAM